MICRGPEPYLDVVLRNRRVFAREGGMGIFFPLLFLFYYYFNCKKKSSLQRIPPCEFIVLQPGIL